jgi:DNA-binding NarL/FixJ family response regulator
MSSHDQRVRYELQGRPVPPPPPTPRDLEIFTSVCRSGSQKQAAYELGVSLQTVKNHCTKLYRRLGVASQLEASVALGWTVLPMPCPTCGHVGRPGTTVVVAARD